MGFPIKYRASVIVRLLVCISMSLIIFIVIKLDNDNQLDLRQLRPTGMNSFYFTSKPKVIAYWDSESAKPGPFLRVENDPFEECPESACIPLPPDGTLEDADAVIFYTRHMSLLTQPEIFPKRAHPGQIFVFHNMESPLRTEGLLEHPVFNDAFNLTMTYRADSDIPDQLVHLVPAAKGIQVRKKHRKHRYGSKTKMAVWFISACTKSGSPRIQYAKELAKYINIDIYGECGNLTCPREEKKSCLKMAGKTYKFYLSFENSACIDYVTEKLRHPLLNNMIPIVMGGIDYGVRAPPHSVIDVKNFKSPKDLAEYLALLDKNEKLYEEYFAWKKTHVVTGRADRAYCALCRILHNSTYLYKTGFSAYEWWYKDTCETEDKLAKNLGLEK